MPTTPTVPLPDNYHTTYPTDRRAASSKQSSSVTGAQWPVVTQAAYKALARGHMPEELVNLPVKRLCAARAQLAQALLIVQAAAASYNPQATANKAGAQGEQGRKVYNRLRSLEKAVEKAMGQVPLELR